jgi:hypothetical protein
MDPQAEEPREATAGGLTVKDRIVQGAVLQAIEPIFEREFATQSYEFRPGKECAVAAYLRKRGHDNYGRGEKVSDPKVNEIGVLRVASGCGGSGCCA